MLTPINPIKAVKPLTAKQRKARLKYIQLQKDWAEIKVCQMYGYKMPKRLQKYLDGLNNV